MRRNPPTFKQALEELIEAPDPLFESVVAYHEGRLHGDEKAAFEARLEGDDAARDLLEELGAFAPVDEATGELPSEFEVASTLRTVRRRSGEAASVGRSTSASMWRLAVAAMALLCFGLAWAWQDARHELAALRGAGGSGLAAAQIHHLIGDGELRGSGSADDMVPVLVGDASRHVLVVTPSEAPTVGHIVACVLTRLGSAAPTTTFDAVVGEHGVVVLSLETDLPPGDYELRLVDPSAGPIESFRFRWAPHRP